MTEGFKNYPWVIVTKKSLLCLIFPWNIVRHLPLRMYMEIQFFFLVTATLNVNVEFHVWDPVYLKHSPPPRQVSSYKMCPRAWSGLEDRDWSGLLCRITIWLGITLAFQWEKVFFVEVWLTVLESLMLFKISIHMGIDVNCFIIKMFLLS